MTVTTSPMISGPYFTDGGNEFDFTFKILAAAHLRVYVGDDVDGTNLVTHSTGFTVADEYLNRDQGGVVVFEVDAGKYLWVGTSAPYEQSSAFTRQGAYNPKFVEGALDALAIQIKQIAQRLSGDVISPTGDPASVVGARTDGSVVVFNSDGDMQAGQVEYDNLSDAIKALFIAAAADSLLAGLTVIGEVGGAVQLHVEENLNATNYWDITGGIAGLGPVLVTKGAQADIDGFIALKGGGALWVGNSYGKMFAVDRADDTVTITFGDATTLAISMTQATFSLPWVAHTYAGVEGVAGTDRMMRFYTNDAGILKGRWFIGAGSGAEGGSNAGSRFSIYRLNDAGSYIDTPFEINRANGNTLITRPVLGLAGYTAAEIIDKTHAVNTTGKQFGLEIIDTTNHRKLYTEGSTDVSPWYVVGGGTTVTPV